MFLWCTGTWKKRMANIKVKWESFFQHSWNPFLLTVNWIINPFGKGSNVWWLSLNGEIAISKLYHASMHSSNCSMWVCSLIIVLADLWKPIKECQLYFLSFELVFFISLFVRLNGGNYGNFLWLLIQLLCQWPETHIHEFIIVLILYPYFIFYTFLFGSVPYAG